MFENTSLDQFSALDVFPSVTPVWRPFVQHATHEPAVSHETQQGSGDCAQ
ncbi:hypothetical protein [Caballeronia insecticola]|uniref:Uncharacterized protein n=1 Tax=Caballeronia insecticola TaxID=758793 RepID=R4WWX3_9BURK|nr:hypothetical protein [Caballeronia insecticola]BAN25600.1 hypothetical protein BRPE64_BCDS09390 [Caballeronia insecticola]